MVNYVHYAGTVAHSTNLGAFSESLGFGLFFLIHITKPTIAISGERNRKPRMLRVEDTG
jgi:hypothetical protein